MDRVMGYCTHDCCMTFLKNVNNQDPPRFLSLLAGLCHHQLPAWELQWSLVMLCTDGIRVSYSEFHRHAGASVKHQQQVGASICLFSPRPVDGVCLENLKHRLGQFSCDEQDAGAKQASHLAVAKAGSVCCAGTSTRETPVWTDTPGLTGS